MQRFARWYLGATSAQRYAYNALLSGVLFGAFATSTSGRRMQAMRDAVSGDLDEVSSVGRKLRVGSAPATSNEAAVMRRIVDYRRREAARRRRDWLWVLPFVALGVAGRDRFSAAGEVLVVVGISAAAFLIVVRRREMALLDRADARLTEHGVPGSTAGTVS